MRREFISTAEFELIEKEYNKLKCSIDGINNSEGDVSFFHSFHSSYFFHIDSNGNFAIKKQEYGNFCIKDAVNFIPNPILSSIESSENAEKKLIRLIDFEFLSSILNQESINRIKNSCESNRCLSNNNKTIFLFESCNKEYQLKINKIIKDYNFYKDNHVEIKEYNEKKHYPDIIEYLEKLEEELNLL